ncbi:hypothetical protein ACFL29_01555 [Patescibacteria group bacterium]
MGDTSTWRAYKKITVELKVNDKVTLSAHGLIGDTSVGVYEFSFENFYYDSCQNKPIGKMTIKSRGNQAEGFFFDDSPKCDPCIPTSINSLYGQWKFCMPEGWLLRDAFEYAEEFFKPPY